MFLEFKDYFTHVLPISDDKKALVKYGTDNDKLKLSVELDNLKALNSAAYILSENAVLFDCDKPENITKIKAMIKGENIKCRMSLSKGTHGGVHLTMLNNGDVEKSNNNVYLACGIVVDIKCGKKNCYEIVKLNNKTYPIEINELGVMPKYFKPLKKGIDFTKVVEGNRVNDLCSHCFTLINEGFTAEETFKCIEIINKYILPQPLNDKDLKAMVLNPKTFNNLLEKQKNSGSVKKRELALDDFKAYLDSKNLKIRYNEVTKQTEFDNLPLEWSACGDISNCLPIFVCDELKKIYKNINKYVVSDDIFIVADANRYNPVHEYFESGKWDGKKRIGRLVKEVLNVHDSFCETLIKKWLIQCVAISYNTLEKPIQAEGVLILIGAEGIGKSRFFRAICPNQNWFRAVSNAINVQRKDDILNAVGGWIVEISEIDATLCRKDSALKAFITNDIDYLRKPYAREETAMARTSSFCGTTNKGEFLNDESGYRRFWCIDVTEINLSIFQKEKDFLKQLWFECYEIWTKNNDGFRLSREERAKLKKINEDKMETLPAQDELMNAFDFEKPKADWHWIQASQIRIMPAYNVGQYSSVTIGKALRAIEKLNLGIEFMKRNGKNQYFIPPFKIKRL